MKSMIPSLRLLSGATATVALLALLLLIPSSARAQDGTTFIVTVANKTGQHPWFGEGWPEGYVIDGEEGPELTLTRGVTYVFQMQNVSVIHPFYISTSAQGGGSGEFSEGVEGNYATGNSSVTFTPPESAPDLMYYQCAAHVRMGGMMNIVSSTSDEALTDLPNTILLEQNYPNPFNPSTSIRFATPTSGSVTLRVFDVMGREVAVLVDGVLPAGAHEVAWDGTSDGGEAVSSGIYVYRIESESGVQARAMTLLR